MGIVVLIICTILIGCFYARSNFVGPKGNDVYIFADITECEGFSIREDIQFSIYDTPIKDSNIGTLSYERFIGGYYTLNNIDFELFAYEFNDSLSAKEYFSKTTGKSDELNTNFSINRGMLTYRLIVIDDKRAYTISSKAENGDEISELLAETFSVKITG